MSLEDILANVLTEIKGLRSDLKGAKAAPAAGAATPPKNQTGGGAAAGGKGATTGAASGGKGGAATPPPKGAANAAAKAGATPTVVKGPGKYNSEQVREAVRLIATNPNLGKQIALDLLDENGGGVQNVSQLKPEFFDAVYEACQVELNNSSDGADAGGGDPDDPLA